MRVCVACLLVWLFICSCVRVIARLFGCCVVYCVCSCLRGCLFVCLIDCLSHCFVVCLFVCLFAYLFARSLDELCLVVWLFD